MRKKKVQLPPVSIPNMFLALIFAGDRCW